LPHQSSIDEDNIDEERRLAYVGITRAQKELTFTLCKERRQYGELVRPEPSRFLLELPQDDLIWEQERKVVSAEERMQKGQRQRVDAHKTPIGCSHQDGQLNTPARVKWWPAAHPS
jgi:ATP-dependent exoDNAse (exonuclease V) beta subunit